MSLAQITSQTFAGQRPYASGEHSDFDAILAVVSDRNDTNQKNVYVVLSCSSLRSIQWPKVFYQIFSIILTMSSPSIPHVSEDRDDTGIPVTCGKCNETFQSDSDYVMHYNEMHADSSSD